MKKIVLLSSAVLGVFLVAGTTSAHADEVVNSKGTKTDTSVTITDADTPNGTDPLDPTDPSQQHLLLKSVPTNYDFSTKVSDGSYEISSGTITGGDTGVVVFNDLSTRVWSVKATVNGGTISRTTQVSGTADNKTFDVTSFKVNGTEVGATGATGIVAKNASTDESNTGSISTPVTSISIGFNDADNSLKKGDKLTGQIDYVLYNSADAK